MPRLPADAALMIIDVQHAIDDPKWGMRNNPHAESQVAALLAAWRESGMPVIHIRHDSIEPDSPYRPGQPGHRFKDEALPAEGETIIGKSTTSAFIGTDLEQRLEAAGITTLVLCGVLTHNSIDATVRHAANLGFRVFVAADACWAVDVVDLSGRRWAAEEVHQLSLAVLNSEYATITQTSAMVEATRMPRPASWKR